MMRSRFLKGWLLSFGLVVTGGLLGHLSVLASRNSAALQGQLSTLGEENLCGAYALHAILKENAVQISLREAIEASHSSLQGTSLLSLRDAARQAGLPMSGSEVSTRRLKELNKPGILLVNGAHFVAMLALEADRVRIVDQKACYWMHWDELDEVFSGVALLVDNPRNSVTSSTRRKGARLHLTNYVVDLIARSQQAPAQYNLTFWNKGDAPLEIREIKTTCGCVIANSSRHLVNPGETGAVAITIQLPGERASTEQSVYLRTNDAEDEWVKVRLRVFMAKDMAASPSILEYGTHPMGSTASKEVRVMFVKGKGSAPKEIVPQVSAAPLKVLVEDMKDYGNFQLATLRVEVLANAPLGNAEGRIRLQIKGEDPKEMDIPVKINIVPPIHVSPSTVYFGVLAKGEPREGKVVLTCGDSIRIAKVEVPEGFRTEYSVSGTTAEIRITCSIPGRVGEVSGMLRVFLESPFTHCMEIPLRGFVKG